MIIRKGSTCYQSEQGERGKLYPDTTNMVIMSRDEECDKMSWVPSQGLIPVYVGRIKMTLWCNPSDLV